jgi:hypothetical protein
VDLKEILWGYGRINLAQDRDQWSSVVKTVAMPEKPVSRVRFNRKHPEYVCHELWRYANLLGIPTSEFRMTMMLIILMDEI